MLRVCALKLFLFLMRDERRFSLCDYTLLAFLMEFERLVLLRIAYSALLFNFHLILQFYELVYTLKIFKRVITKK